MYYCQKTAIQKGNPMGVMKPSKLNMTTERSVNKLSGSQTFNMTTTN